MRPWFAIASFSIISVGCGLTPTENSSEKIIINESDLSYYTEDNQISRSIGKMRKGCTVTHIGQNLAITAGHCVRYGHCEGSNYDVAWNYRANTKETYTSQCKRIVIWEFSDDMDYAVLEYSNAPSDSLNPNASSRPRYSDYLTIFSHPEGQPLMWSNWCQHDGDDMGKRFSYQCDTKGGSSGAAVLNENLEIVGIHNQGNYGKRVNSGTYLIDIKAFQ